MTMMLKKHYFKEVIPLRVHIIAKGRVQGVGFRFSAWQKAMEYDLTGYARNLTNGDVELEVEGSESNIEAFIKDLEAGLNPFIRVDRLEVEKLDTEKGYRDFRMG